MQPEKQYPILFHSNINPEYSYLSNFYEAPFKVGQHIYKTNEHFFQSQKFVGKPQQLEVINAVDPKKAKSLGRSGKMDRPQDWPVIKENIMLIGLRAKFSQNEDLKKKLLDTGDRVLRQHTGADKYWGDGGVKNTGKNRLGILLMQVRDQLRKAKNE